jgi:hypothetical protein
VELAPFVADLYNRFFEVTPSVKTMELITRQTADIRAERLSLKCQLEILGTNGEDPLQARSAPAPFPHKVIDLGNGDQFVGRER